MNFDALFDAGPVIAIHAILGVAAFVLGLAVFFRRKGGSVHRWLGRVWVAMMGVIAVTSFFINEIQLWGPFSPIHILSVITLFGLVSSIRAIRSGRVKEHQNTMRNIFAGGLVLAGAFAFLPGRLMSRMLGDGVLTNAAAFIWVAIPLLLYGIYRLQNRAKKHKNGSSMALLSDRTATSGGN